ncbi:MAG: RelA/SpoT domain-containing protein [Sedimentisphaerales bacterium]|nr:RelA/SpoT domain-containing protein [Sedimentisphaerales bacterium]
MAFARVPRESRNQINKAGAILAADNPDFRDYAWALDLADRWRACHAYPINTFQATLRTKLRSYPEDPIAAQRLKRMPTIIDKLKRYPAMKLSTMQDIGGVRAILGSVKDVYRLVGEYKDSQRLSHELTDHKDYIQSPRSEDGYRSAHLIYKYKNKLARDYDGLRIELQIRTKLQHIWATAVESMGTFLGQALKSRQGDQEWLDFFALISSAFSHRERTAPVPRFSALSPQATYAAIASAEARLGALNMMSGLSVAANAIYKTRGTSKGWFYHLIILNSLGRTVQIQPYDRDSFSQAVLDYKRVEAEAAKGAKIEPVLVSAGPLDNLRRAYPNFFLDINDFVKIVTEIVTEARR